jgi:GntR family transcriptional regulator
MLEQVDIHSSVPVYVQIENEVQFAIASGQLKAGDQLPSVRALSDQLDVNPNTVAKSYRDLEVMGLLYTRRGMGVFINKGIENRCREETLRRVIGRLHEVVSEAKAAGMTAEDVKSITNKSYQIGASPYGATPSELLTLAKKKRK